MTFQRQYCSDAAGDDVACVTLVRKPTCPLIGMPVSQRAPRPIIVTSNTHTHTHSSGIVIAQLRIKANSHRHARHGKTVLCVSRPLRRCELWFPDNSRLSPTENMKSENVHSSGPISHRRTRHDIDRTVLSCLVRRCESSRPDRPTSAFSVGVCWAAQCDHWCDRWTHSDAERTCRAVGPTQFTPPDTTQTALRQHCRAESGGRCELGITSLG